jgi:hypothetical protein
MRLPTSPIIEILVIQILKISGFVDSDVDNACYGLGPFVTLTVEKLPIANPISIPRQCDDNQDGIFTFNTSNLETTLLGTNQTFRLL